MAELKRENVFTQTVLSSAEFCERHEGITNQALKYAREKDLIDYIKVGRVYLIVMTAKTLDYVPNSNKNRG